MRPPSRRALRLAAFLLLAAAAAWPTLKILFPAEKIRRLAIEALEPKLGREVRIARATLSLRGVALEGLEISRIPKFSAGVLFKAGRLEVAPKLLPLLRHKRLEISRLILQDWTLDLPLEEALPEQGERPKVSASPRSIPSWRVGHVLSKRGTVRYAQGGETLSLDGIELDAEDAAPLGAFPLRLSLRLARGSGKKALTLRVELAGSLDAGGGNLEKASLLLKPLKLEVEGIPLKAEGSLKNFREPQADLNLSLEALPAARLGLGAPWAKSLSLPKLSARLRALKRSGLVRIDEFSGRGEGLRASASGSVQLLPQGPLPDLRFDLVLKLPSLRVPAPAGSKTREVELPALSLQGKGGFHGRELLLSPLRLAGGGLELELAGSARFDKTPSWSLRARTNSFALERFAPLVPAAAPYAPAGHASLELSLERSSGKDSLAGRVECADARALWNSHEFSQLKGFAEFDAKKAKAVLSGRLDGAALDLDAEAQGALGEGPLDVRLKGSLAQLDVERWLPKETAPPPASPKTQAPSKPRDYKVLGTFAVGRVAHPQFQAEAVQASWALKGRSDSLASLSGELRFKTGPGRFENLNTLSSKSRAAKVALMPLAMLQKIAGLVKVPLFPAFDKVRFREIVGDYAFENGVVTLRKSYMDSDAAYVSMAGSADLARETLNLRVSTKLGTQVGLKLSGPLGLQVRGTFSDPKVSVDPTNILRQPGVEQVLEGGKKLLKGLFK